jgi:hypothetical protein
MKQSAGRTQLYAAMKACVEHWQDTRRSWRDSVAKEFEDNCLEPLQAQVQGTLRAADRLWVVLGQMEQDCQ